MTEIELKSPEEIEKMSRASRIVAEVLEALRHQIKPGVTTEELDRFAEKFILERGGKPAFKGYRVRDKIYQHTLCVSVNEEVVHGIPSHRVLKEGDIVTGRRGRRGWILWGCRHYLSGRSRLGRDAAPLAGDGRGAPQGDRPGRRRQQGVRHLPRRAAPR